MGRDGGRHGLATTGLIVIALAVSTALLLIVPTPLGLRVRTLLHFHEPHRLLPAVTVAHQDRHYAFLQTEPGSKEPVTYNPCKPIRYVVNPSGGPDDALRLITTAVARISKASGLAFEYDGTTHDTDFSHRTESDPVLIGFVAPGALKDMTVESNHIGLGGSTAFGGTLGRRTYKTGMVALREDWFSGSRPSRAEKRAVIMHELGHVVGLGHVRDPHELMDASNDGQTTLGPGDRTGLALLGRGPCT